APLGWSGSPRAFQPAGDGMCTVAVAEGVLPAEALLLDIGAFGFSANILGRDPRAMGFTEGVSAGYQRNRFHVIHRHAGEGLADIARRRNRVRTSIGTFGLDIDQTHLYGAERTRQLTIAAVALGGQPSASGSPE